MWQTKDINPLSPRKAAWATWQYVEPGAAAIRRATLEQARDVEPVGGDYIDAGGWYVGYAHGVRAKTDAIAALIEGDAAINAKPPAP